MILEFYVKEIGVGGVGSKIKVGLMIVFFITNSTVFTEFKNLVAISSYNPSKLSIMEMPKNACKGIPCYFLCAWTVLMTKAY